MPVLAAIILFRKPVDFEGDDEIIKFSLSAES